MTKCRAPVTPNRIKKVYFHKKIFFENAIPILINVSLYLVSFVSFILKLFSYKKVLRNKISNCYKPISITKKTNIKNQLIRKKKTHKNIKFLY